MCNCGGFRNISCRSLLIRVGDASAGGLQVGNWEIPKDSALVSCSRDSFWRPLDCSALLEEHKEAG